MCGFPPDALCCVLYPQNYRNGKTTHFPCDEKVFRYSEKRFPCVEDNFPFVETLSSECISILENPVFIGGCRSQHPNSRLNILFHISRPLSFAEQQIFPVQNVHFRCQRRPPSNISSSAHKLHLHVRTKSAIHQQRLRRHLP